MHIMDQDDPSTAAHVLGMIDVLRFAGFATGILCYHLNYPPVWCIECGTPRARPISSATPSTVDSSAIASVNDDGGRNSPVQSTAVRTSLLCEISGSGMSHDAKSDEVGGM